MEVDRVTADSLMDLGDLRSSPAPFGHFRGKVVLLLTPLSL